MPALFAALPAEAWVLICVAAMLVFGCLLTPMLALSLMMTAFLGVFAGLGVDIQFIGILLVLAGVAAMVLRSMDWAPSLEAASSLHLSRTIGLIAVAMPLVVIALTLAFWRAIQTLKLYLV